MKKEYTNLKTLKNRLEKAKTPGEVSKALESLSSETQFLLGHVKDADFNLKLLDTLVKSCMMHDASKATVIGVLTSLTA